MATVKIYYGGSTSIAVIMLLLLLQLKPKWLKIILPLGLIFSLSMPLAFIKPYLDILVGQNNIKIGDVINMHPVFALDVNTTMRIFMWGYLFFEVFLNNIFGIGLGTVLLPRYFVWNKMQLYIYDPHLEYTLGAHNSFLTILVRFGIIGFLPFIFLYIKLIKDFLKVKQRKRDSSVLYFYYAFFIITGCAMLNVVLESPMHASLYWGILGMLYQAKQSQMDA